MATTSFRCSTASSSSSAHTSESNEWGLTRKTNAAQASIALETRAIHTSPPTMRSTSSHAAMRFERNPSRTRSAAAASTRE